MLTRYIPGSDMVWAGVQVLAIAAGFAVAALVGLVFVIAYLGVSPILATLGTMSVLQGPRHRPDPWQCHFPVFRPIAFYWQWNGVPRARWLR